MSGQRIRERGFRSLNCALPDLRTTGADTNQYPTYFVKKLAANEGLGTDPCCGSFVRIMAIWIKAVEPRIATGSQDLNEPDHLSCRPDRHRPFSSEFLRLALIRHARAISICPA